MKKHPITAAVAIVCAVASWGGAGVIAQLVLSGRIIYDQGAQIALTLLCSVYLLAAVTLAQAGLRTRNREGRVWLLLAGGCAFGGIGWVSYAWLLANGLTFFDPPPQWLAIPRVFMYGCWLGGLWLLRQPLVAATRRERLLSVGSEMAALVLVAATALAALWNPAVSTQINMISAAPIAGDMVLIAAAYHAVRRASLERGAAHVWLVFAFSSALLSHVAGSFVFGRGLVWTGVLAVGFMGTALAGMVMASALPLRTRETILGGERVTAAVAAIGLAFAGPAAFMVPAILAPAVWVVAGALAYRVHHMMKGHGQSDIDPLTGLNDARAMNRHIGGVAARATTLDPVAVIGADLAGFGRWNAEHGFAAGDELLVAVADRCIAAPIAPGVWGRIGPDRFCWVGQVDDVTEAIGFAELIAVAASDNAMKLTARCAVVMCPDDAATPANVLSAMDEALAAASQMGRPVVAFDRGLLDGAPVEGGYSASFRSRRALLEEVISNQSTIRPVFQPIVRLEDFTVVGHEALTRVDFEPRRGPDTWIAEAHQLGLGLEMESECIRRALARVGEMPAGTYLALNTSPQLILSGLLDALMPEGGLQWLLIELTEHDQVSDYGELATSLDGLRARGARVAVDDLGAGHSTMRHVVRLDPDYAKLDRSIVEGIDGDPAKRALVRSMLAFSTEMETQLVAEGIERHEELETLRAIGVQYGQGYLFRRPAPEMATTVAIDAAPPPAPPTPARERVTPPVPVPRSDTPVPPRTPIG